MPSQLSYPQTPDHCHSAAPQKFRFSVSQVSSFCCPLPPPGDILVAVRVQFGVVFQHCFDLYRVRRKTMRYIEKTVRYRFG